MEKLKIGDKVETIVSWPEVPKGTKGIIVEDYGSGVTVAWDLPGKPLPKDKTPTEIGKMFAVDPACPLRDGFNKKSPEYETLKSLEPKIVVPNKKWGKEWCGERAAVCETKFDFSKNYPRVYAVSERNNWLKDFFGLRSGERKKWTKKVVDRKEWGRKNWSYEEIAKVAKECRNRSDLWGKFPIAHQVARENKWLDDFFGENGRKRKGWTNEQVQEIAAKCKNRTELYFLNNSAYHYARNNDLLDEFFPSTKKEWTKDLVFKMAEGCKSRTDLVRKSQTACKVARENGWLDELFGESLSGRKMNKVNN